MKKNYTARELAAASLVSFEKNGRYSNLEVDATLRRVGTSLSAADCGFYTRLVYGVVERVLTLDHIAAEYSSRKLSDVDIETLTAIRLGIYQLLYMDRVPDFAAVSESVDLAPSRSRGFVNGVLRSFLRSKKKFTLPVSGRDYISLKYSVSPEICDIFTDSWGNETAERILSSSFNNEGVALRINTLRLSVDKAERILSENEHDDGFSSDGLTDESKDISQVKRSSLCPDVLFVPRLNKTARDGISNGFWFVQDEASRIASTVLGARPGDKVVDCCAAPGGKTFSTAIDMENTGEIFSFDLHKNKLSLIKEGSDRLGLTIVNVAERDAGRPDKALFGSCDRVLCDAPCSGLGVISKKPEIRYKDAQSVARLPEVQRRVLTGASSYVKEGGFLVYSTCTLNRRENEDVVRRFLSENSSFIPEDFAVSDLRSENGMLTLLPHISGCDGFFIAKMRKTR